MNQAESPFGLNRSRLATLIGKAASMPRACRKSSTSFDKDLLEVTGAEPRLGHRRRIDKQLQGRHPAGEDVRLEPGRNFDHEDVATAIQGVGCFGATRRRPAS